MAVEKGEVKSNEKVACLITGSGFKDMSSVDEHFKLQQPEKLENVYSLKQQITNLI
jgi:threonine synthase